MDDFFKNLRGDLAFKLDDSSASIINESSLFLHTRIEDSVLGQQSNDNSEIIQHNDDDPLNAVKVIDLVDTDDTQLQSKLNELTDKEDLSNEKKSDSDEGNNTVIIDPKSESVNRIIGKVEPVDVKEINDKLNEITEQSQAAIEDLRSQSTKIIDSARAQTNKVLENAKYNFSVFTKAMEEEEANKQKEPATVTPVPTTPAEDTFEQLMEKYSTTGNIMDFFN